MEANIKSQENTLLRGGQWLVQKPGTENLLIPESFTEEQQSIAQMFSSFVETEIRPHLAELDKMDPPGLMLQKMKKAGEQGMLGVSIPEAYGGFGLKFDTGLLATEAVGSGHSFSVALAAHTGIGTLPILYFGSEAQKEKYLPKLASGELMASYCLTEPGSGSDALGAKTKAVLSADGKHYVLNGQKMWITNAGFADLFVVFAKIDGQHFTGFIVERESEGLSFGEEEHKMGIKGSSTRQVFFSDVKVPVENVLGEIGKGHLIAFNILNIGRIKLAAATLGAAKQVASDAIRYATERQQFQTPIAQFGAIQHKLAEQAIRIFATESATYRTSHYIQQYEEQLQAAGKTYGQAVLGAAQEYAAECAVLKVLGSETLDYVVDEGVQILGGYGFSAEYPMDRAYRDSRINRIFEGTNEINRMLTVDYLLKKALKGELDLLGPAMAVQKELMEIPDFNEPEGEWAAAEKAVGQFKKAILMVAGYAAQRFMQKLTEQQEILMAIADMVMYTYTTESTLLRLQKLAPETPYYEEKKAMLHVYLSDSADRIHQAARLAIIAMAEGDEQRMMLMGAKRFTKVAAVNTVALRRKVAQTLIAQNRYPF
ncbi:MAG: acyl-CoA dehydrogenase family protein [Sphingobacteriia bacterium]|jgi:alkylation response protein AidB-like acyl-CoA dehydrogenase